MVNTMKGKESNIITNLIGLIGLVFVMVFSLFVFIHRVFFKHTQNINNRNNGGLDYGSMINV